MAKRNKAADPQENHEDQLQGDDRNVQQEEQEVLVRTMTTGQNYNGHPLEPNTVIRLPVSVVEKHRERGWALEDVADDYDGEVYDVSEPWQPPQQE